MTSTLIGKVWAILVLVMIVLHGIFLGMDLQANDSKEAITDGILLAFWVILGVWLYFFSLREQKLDMELEQSRRDLDLSMDKLLGGLKKKLDREAAIPKALHDANVAVCGDRPPKPSEFKKVEAKFHEITGDLYLKLEATKGDKRPSAEVSNEPFTKTPARKAKK